MALGVNYDKENRKIIRKNAMSLDLSWNNASEEYIALYKELIKGDN